MNVYLATSLTEPVRSMCCPSRVTRISWSNVLTCQEVGTVGKVPRECHSVLELAQFQWRCAVCMPTGYDRIDHCWLHDRVDNVRYISQEAWRQNTGSI